MLEIFILKCLMNWESRSMQVGGILPGWSLTYIMQEKKVPRTTFYRAVNVLIAHGVIVKQKRNSYIISNEFRLSANKLKDHDRIRS